MSEYTIQHNTDSTISLLKNYEYYIYDDTTMLPSLKNESYKYGTNIIIYKNTNDNFKIDKYNINLCLLIDNEYVINDYIENIILTGETENRIICYESDLGDIFYKIEYNEETPYQEPIYAIYDIELNNLYNSTDSSNFYVIEDNVSYVYLLDINPNSSTYSNLTKKVVLNSQITLILKNYILNGNDYTINYYFNNNLSNDINKIGVYYSIFDNPTTNDIFISASSYVNGNNTITLPITISGTYYVRLYCESNIYGEFYSNKIKIVKE